ncbi:MAG: YtxH domain-containing protein, partial [Gemmatimonas sp.]
RAILIGWVVTGIGMLLLGLALGAGAALLFAPASGRETRERLSREARRAGRRVKDLTEELGDTVADQVERARFSVDEQVGRAKDAVQSRVEAVNDAVSASMTAASHARADIERAVEHSKQAYADGRRAYGERTRRASGAAGPANDEPHLQHGAGGEADGVADQG